MWVCIVYVHVCVHVFICVHTCTWTHRHTSPQFSDFDLFYMKAFPCWALVTGFTYLFGVTYLPAKQGGCVDIVLEPGAFRGFHWPYDITFSFLFLVLCGRTRQAMNSLFCCSDVLIKMNSWNIVFWVQSQVLSWDNKTSKKKTSTMFSWGTFHIHVIPQVIGFYFEDVMWAIFPCMFYLILLYKRLSPVCFMHDTPKTVRNVQ